MSVTTNSIQRLRGLLALYSSLYHRLFVALATIVVAVAATAIAAAPCVTGAASYIPPTPPRRSFISQSPNLLLKKRFQFVIQFRCKTLFDNYRIFGQNEDQISFVVDVSLLHRVVRSAATICCDSFSDSNNNCLWFNLLKKLLLNERIYLVVPKV
ncbi:hypothetical protein S245_018066 [Arachis hypogaea]